MFITLWRPSIASCASRLRRTHHGDSIFVDLDDVASGVCAAREAFEAFRSPENDRVGIGAGLDRVPLVDLWSRNVSRPCLRVPNGSISPTDASIASITLGRPGGELGGSSSGQSESVARYIVFGVA